MRNMTEPKIYVAGHKGMVGSAIVRALQAQGHTRFVTRSHAQLDLTNQAAVREFFAQEKPDQVYLAAAKVGGIHANNTYPAEFIYQNLMMQANVIDAAFQSGVKKLLFLGSSCIYPKLAAQPMTEDALLTGTLEPTNEPYGRRRRGDCPRAFVERSGVCGRPGRGRFRTVQATRRRDRGQPHDPRAGGCDGQGLYAGFVWGGLRGCWCGADGPRVFARGDNWLSCRT